LKWAYFIDVIHDELCYYYIVLIEIYRKVTNFWPVIFEKIQEKKMRKVVASQMQLGSVDISKIKFDSRCRDEIPQLLRGLQYIWSNIKIRDEIFKILKGMVPPKVNIHIGRPGMELWTILVLGTIRLNCNWDYDKVHDISNNHRTIRQMLGHGILTEDYYYPLQTIKDNVSLFTPDILDKINEVVVKAGHSLLLKKKGEDLKVRCDSFVVETDVHYPTDINLLFDAIRKVIILLFSLCVKVNIGGWRESRSYIRKIKKLYRRAQNCKRSTSKDEKKKAKQKKLIIEAHKIYIDLVEAFLERSKETIKKIRGQKPFLAVKLLEVEKYITDAERQIDQIRRRVLKGEIIPHEEKVFSIFEEHTEWICKGKAGVPQELGLRVCILEDKYGFILHHRVMENETDDAITVEIVKEGKERYCDLKSCSFDKGFYSPSNRKGLEELLEKVILPKKGKLSGKDKEIEEAEAFIQAKRKHSAVESAINGLENHSLDRCCDHGIKGFKRYVAIAVLARNIQNLGKIIHKKEVKRQKRFEKFQQRRENQTLLAA
jgi:transposase, IS5 family